MLTLMGRGLVPKPKPQPYQDGDIIVVPKQHSTEDADEQEIPPARPHQRRKSKRDSIKRSLIADQASAAKGILAKHGLDKHPEIQKQLRAHTRNH